MISTKIFHAIGYHVPEDFIVTFDLSRLDVAPGAKIQTESGAKRPIEMADVEQWLKNTPRTGERLDSRARQPIRAGQSRRAVPLHRDAARRSERHLSARAAARAARPARVRRLAESRRCAIDQQHRYLCGGRRPALHPALPSGFRLEPWQRQHLGAAAARRQRVPDRGRQDRARGSSRSGCGRRDWTKVRYPTNPSLGNIEADFFQPEKWKTEYPQPAFDQMDAADAFWAASIASRFSNEMIKAIVDTGELSDPEAARYLTDVIIRRRDKVVAMLDRPDESARPLRGPPHGERRRADVRQRGDPCWTWRSPEPPTRRAGWRSTTPRACSARSARSSTLRPRRVAIPDAAWGPADAAGSRYAIASIKTIDASHPSWTSPVLVTVRTAQRRHRRRRHRAADANGWPLARLGFQLSMQKMDTEFEDASRRKMCRPS